MDVGQSPIEFIDHQPLSRTPTSSYYNSSNIGALSSRLHQLRPAGSIPFSGRTNMIGMSNTLPRQMHQSSKYDYDPNSMMMMPPFNNNLQSNNKSLSSQNLLNSMPNNYTGGVYEGNMLNNQVMMSDKPRPSSARDPNWMLYENPGIYNSRTPVMKQVVPPPRYRNNRSSSFETGGVQPQDYSLSTQNPPQIVDYLMDPSQLYLSQQHEGYSMQRELSRLQQDLELTKDKLASSLNSIKTFWSPELKRERALRKDENSKYVLLAEELHQLHMEKKSMLSSLHQLETDLRREKELRNKHSQSAADLDLLHRRCEELDKDNRLLAKQAEEADKRAQYQKESLATAEENIRKLLEVVKASKSSGGMGLSGSLERFEETQIDMERLRAQLQDYSNRTLELERALVDRDFELARLKEQIDMLTGENQALRQENESIHQDVQQTQTLQALVDTKESKILTLENEMRLLEDELARMRDEELLTPTSITLNGATTAGNSAAAALEEFEKALRNPSGVNLRPHERLLKSKMEALSVEMSKRDSEIYSLQSRLEMAEKQHQDQNHHINVLKEQVKTREHKISMLMADVEDFRKRLKEKETLLEKKSQILSCSQSEKHQTESEIIELKDQNEMKDKKISLLQRKVENLEDLLNDKENQLCNAKSKLTTLHSDYTNTEGTKVNLEEALRDKERQIDRIKEAKARMEHEYQDELEMQKKQASETKSRLENSERDLRDKQAMLTELREELAELRSAKFKRDSDNNQLQVQLSQRASEVAALQLEVQTMKKQHISDTEYKSSHRIAELESQVNHYSESASRLQGEVDRLLNLARNLENEKLDKDRQIHQLDTQLKENQMKMNNLLRTSQNEKDYLAEELESLKRKEDNVLADMEIVKSSLVDREARIKELEQALRESVKLSAERENYLHSQEDSCKQLETKVTDQRQSLEQVQKERNNLSQQLLTAQDELRDKDMQLKTLESECFKNYIPELDRQRKSNQELILRVQALVKLCQGREFQLSEQERISLGELGLYPDSYHQSRVNMGGRVSAVPYSSVMKSPHISWASGAVGGGGLMLPHSSSHTMLGGGGPHSAFHSPHGLSGVPPSGTSLHYDEVAKLSRLLHEKEQMLHQQIEDMSRLRLQNSELEARLKGLEERLGTSLYSTNKYMTGSSVGLVGSNQDLASLRQMNTELSSKVTYLKGILEEKDEKLKTLSNESRSHFLQMEVERIKREMTNTIAEKDSHITMLASEVEKHKNEKMDINENLIKAHAEIKEKSDKINYLESEQSRNQMDKESLQKKYQTALTHLSEKTDKIQQLERDCYQKQQDEIKRLKLENEENSHRLTFMQKSLTDRDSRIEQLEKDHYKLRDDMSSIQKLHHNADSEVKRLKDELLYREQRIKQVQNSHTEELNQLRTTNQELVVRMSQMKQTFDDKDQLIKNKVQELEKWKSEYEMVKRKLRDQETDMTRFTNDLAEKENQIKTLERDYADEIQRYQKASEDASNRLNLMQKRVDERESRMKKIELENNELLDEIHSLRKRNHEMESQMDLVKQQILLDKDCSSAAKSLLMQPSYTPTASSVRAGVMSGDYSASMIGGQQSDQVDSLRRQLQEAQLLNSQLQKAANETTLQIDRLTMDRDFLTKKMEDLNLEHDKLKQQMHKRDTELKSREIELVTKNSAESTKYSQQTQELMQTKCELIQEIETRDLQISELSRELESVQHQKLDWDTTMQAQNMQLKDMQTYIDQLIRERDDARVIASSTTGYGSSSYRMNIQEQIRMVQQQLDKTTADFERSQKENHELRTRIQELSRQLKETQSNWDQAVKERDSYKQQATIKARGDTQITQLSKEMERLHLTEQENTKKLEQANKQTAEAKRELEKVRKEYQDKLQAAQIQQDTSQREMEKIQIALREQQEQNERREEEISNSQQEESEKLKHSHSTLSKKFITLQHEFETKERQMQQLSETLEQIRRENNELNSTIDDLHNRNQQLEYDTSNNQMEKDKLVSEKKELEGWLNQMTEALNNKGNEIANLQQQQTRRKSVDIQQMNMQNQIRELTEQLELKDKQLDEVNRQLENSTQEIQEQEYMIQELSQKLDNMEMDVPSLAPTMQQRKPEQHHVSTNTVAAQPLHHQYSSKSGSYSQQSSVDHQSNAEMERLRQELSSITRQLQEKDQRVQLLETECFQQQADEIERLRRELRQASHSNQTAPGQGGMDSRRSSAAQSNSSTSGYNQSSMSHSYSNHDVQSLKVEVDSLKKEINIRNDQLEKQDRECQEKHIRRIDSLQMKLKKAEEEINQMERQMEEMRRALEDRDRMLKQVKQNQHQATSVELEKLRDEFNRCQEELNKRNKQIQTLEKQINSQIKEILEIKQEALTASICEKDANIALLQMTGANNSHAQQALQKMNNEKSQLQSQLKQLSSTRQKLQEQNQ